MKKRYLATVATFAIAIGAQLVTTPSYATEQGEQRRDARDTKQSDRPDARQQKAECRAGDEKSRPECRQDKRGAKQDTRETARDIKYQ